MSDSFTAIVVEEDVHLSLVELCRACDAQEEQVQLWVVEGVLSPIGSSPPEWRFTGTSLRRARIALTLTRELEINPPGVALALDLLDRIDALEAGLRRVGRG